MRGLLTVLFLGLSGVGYAQKTIGWLQTGQVASKVYGNLHPRIQLDKYNNPLVVWGDENGHGWFARWGGEAFSNPMQINNAGTEIFATSWAGPDIASRGDTVYVVYNGLPDDKYHIYTRHSYDGGLNFSVPEKIEPEDGNINQFPIVAADENGNPYVAYLKTNKNNTNPQYVVQRSDDMGESFKGETPGSLLAGGRACECSPAALAVSGTAAALVYRSNLGGQRNIYASLSTEGASRFIYGLQLDSTQFTPPSCPASGPDAVVVGDLVYSVFLTGKGETGMVYLSRLNLSNQTYIARPITGAIPGVDMQNFPRIAGYGDAAAIVWTQTAAANNQVCLYFTPELGKGFPAKYDTVATGVMLNADVAMGGGYIYVVWEDQEKRCVMFRRGVFANKKAAYDNTSIIISSPPKGQKFFWINHEGILSCTLTDRNGSPFEMDISYPKGNNYCRVATEEMDPGTYTVKIWDSEGRTYNAQVEIK